MTGGALFPGAVTMKVSIRHCPELNAFFPLIYVATDVATITDLNPKTN